MSTKHTPGLRGSITKSKAGHYTVTLRSSQGALLSIQDKQPTLRAARELLAMLKSEHREAAIAKATGSEA